MGIVFLCWEMFGLYPLRIMEIFDILKTQNIGEKL